MPYDIGDRRKLTIEIRNEADELADPDALSFTMTAPDGVTTYVYGTDAELDRDSLGTFHVYWDCAVLGVHTYKWATTGSLATVETGSFQVGRSGYPTALDLSDWLSPTENDDLTQWCVDAAIAAVEKSCGRTFLTTEPEQRTYQAEYFRGRTLVDIDDLMTDDLVIEVDGHALTGYTLLPRNAAQHGKPWTQIELPGCVHGWVSITARWGWLEVPPAIRTAVAITAGRLYDRRQNVAGSITDQRIDDVEYKWNVSALDPDVENIIRPFRKLWAAV
ncbi:hypothetical protein ACXDF8_26510 [Mycolicibacterium sp. CBM1]